jgi:hypothetical protein
MFSSTQLSDTIRLTQPREIFDTGLSEKTMRDARLVCNRNPWTGSATSIRAI